MAPSKGGKKKPPAHSDFSKAKSSLKAKQKATPSNATNTSFKSRSIVLPNQGTVTQIEERKQTRLTDDKGRGVEELVTILRGVGSGGTGNQKAEALDSLNVLCSRLPDRVTLSLGLLPIILPLITSNSSSIRLALHRFMIAFLKDTPHDALVPYVTIMTLWVTSGMNHIWKEVREDAAKLGEVVIDAMGTEIVRGWQWPNSDAEAATNGQRIFTTLLTALGVDLAGSTGTSQQKNNTQSDLSTSPVTKLRLLSCLEKLIRCQSGLQSISAQDSFGGGHGSDVDPSSSQFPLWIFRSCLQNASDWEAFSISAGQRSTQSAIKLQGTAMPAEIATFTANPALVEKQYSDAYLFADPAASAGLACGDEGLVKALGQKFVAAAGGVGEMRSISRSSNPYLQLYACLHSLLLHTLLDHAPGVLGPEAANASTQQDPPMGLRLLETVFRLTRTLFRATLRSLTEETGRAGDSNTLPGADKEALEGLSTLLGHSGVYFPFESRRASEPLNRIATLRLLSAGWCELVGIRRMLMGSGSKESLQAKRKQRVDNTAAHIQSVEAYLIQVLQESTSGNASASQIVISSDTTPHSRLSDAEYLALIPTLWHLLTDARTREGNPEDENDRAALLSVFVAHWSSAKVSTLTKSIGFTFLSSICSLLHHPSLRTDIRKRLARPSSPIYRVLRDDFIVRSMGRYIYEVGMASQRLSALIPSLHTAWVYLLNSVRFTSPLVDEDILLKLLPTLQPFFWITRSTGMPGPGKRLFAENTTAIVHEVKDVVRAFVDFVKADVGQEKAAEGFCAAVEKAGVR